ncbi:lipopolysaccharide heptosyltransferase family protein [Candidatus Thioglobus sp.]|nr:lipopolysaccharide heptosyltransferase family protein [Candidatus Thioglobus sp.]
MKYLRRYLYIYLKGQRSLEIFSILPVHKNILWINMSAPSLGDSLMDLSSRSLLKGKNIDLFTDVKNAHIYEDDLFLNNIYTKILNINQLKYDLVVIDSFSTRSIKVKSKVAPKTSYVGMFGYFNGPEVNRTLFSFYQMNNLLGSYKSENEIKTLARNSLTISEVDKNIVQSIIPQKYISFVLGGEWSYRTYEKWGEVISKIISDNKQEHIIFLGSKNAKNSAEMILKFHPHSNIFNLVDKLSFNQTAEVLKKSIVVFCCDGGLMHAANAVNAKNIILFARKVPALLLTENSDSTNLYDDKDVNNIPSEAILSAYYEIIAS